MQHFTVGAKLEETAQSIPRKDSLRYMAGCHADIRVPDSFSQLCEDSFCQALQLFWMMRTRSSALGANFWVKLALMRYFAVK